MLLSFSLRYLSAIDISLKSLFRLCWGGQHLQEGSGQKLDPSLEMKQCNILVHFKVKSTRKATSSFYPSKYRLILIRQS